MDVLALYYGSTDHFAFKMSVGLATLPGFSAD